MQMMQNYMKNLINFRYLLNLYKDRYSDADFTAKKLLKSFFNITMDFDGFLEDEPFQNSDQS